MDRKAMMDQTDAQTQADLLTGVSGTLEAPEITPTRRAAQQRLRCFVPHSGAHYASHRNADYGPCDRSNVSVLSPALRHRLLLETDTLAAVLERYALSTADKFVQEVFWRGYFKGFLEQHPGIWTAYRQGVDGALRQLEVDGSLRATYSRAIAGETGIECFDAWALQLVATGYLHNHARMWFASIWIFALKLPWELGADFFLRHLMDGDPASNTLSWRWVGGLHTKGKTYLARPDNIARYTNGRFKPGSELAPDAAPLQDDAVHQRRPIRKTADTLDAGERPLLLVTEEDCCVETLAADLEPVAVVGLTVTERRSPLAIGERAQWYARGAVTDALARAQAHYGCPVAMLEHGNDPVAAILGEIKQRCASSVVTAYTPVGPVCDVVRDVSDRLEDVGGRLIELRRDIDQLTWPHATRGFFKVKKAIPSIIEDLRDRDVLALSVKAG